MIGVIESKREKKELIPVEGLVASWNLNKNYTESINGFDAPGTNTVFIDGSVYLNGSNAYMTVSDNDLFSFCDDESDKPFTWEWEAKFEVDKSSRFIVKDGASTNREYLIGYTGSGLSILLFSENGSSFIRRDYSFDPELETWYNFKISYDGSGSEDGIVISIGGEVVDSSGNKSGTYSKMKNTNNNVYFGFEQRTFSQFFKGNMRNIRLYDRVI